MSNIAFIDGLPSTIIYMLFYNAACLVYPSPSWAVNVLICIIFIILTEGVAPRQLRDMTEEVLPHTSCEVDYRQFSIDTKRK